MSSTYRILCLSHDPAIESDRDYSSPGEAADAIAFRLEGHPDCDLAVGRYSLPLIEVGCPPRRHRSAGPNCLHSETEWVDVGVLRLLAVALRSTDPDARQAAEDARLRCWPLERLRRLRRDLDLSWP